MRGTNVWFCGEQFVTNAPEHRYSLDSLTDASSAIG
jgi:hypothetical protein